MCHEPLLMREKPIPEEIARILQNPEKPKTRYFSLSCHKKIAYGLLGFLQKEKR